jgi:hypothetical protein
VIVRASLRHPSNPRSKPGGLNGSVHPNRRSRAPFVVRKLRPSNCTKSVEYSPGRCLVDGPLRRRAIIVVRGVRSRREGRKSRRTTKFQRVMPMTSGSECDRDGGWTAGKRFHPYAPTGDEQEQPSLQ